MGKETKIGLVVVAILAVFLGAFAVQKFHRPGPVQSVSGKDNTQLAAASTPTPDPLDSPPVVVETGGFSADVSSGNTTDEITYPPDDTLVDIPDGPGTSGNGTYHDGEVETIEEPVRWTPRHDTNSRQAMSDPQDYRELGSSEAADSTFDQQEHSEYAANPGDHAGQVVLPDQSETVYEPTHEVTTDGQMSTMAVDDGRSSAGSDDTGASTPNLFEGAQNEPPATASAPPARMAAPARAVAPRDAFSAAPPESQQWIVKEGDSFWSIARERYGSGRYFKALARWNEKTVADPERISLGTVLETPPLAMLQQAHPELMAESTANPTQHLPGLAGRAVPEQAGAFADPLGQKYYRVGRADTLFGIAKKTLGQGGRWQELFELNEDVLEDADRLAPGMILRLPASAAVEELLSSRPAAEARR